MCGLLPTPYFTSGTALGTTKEIADRSRPLLRTHCEKFACGRCISVDLSHTQELKGIRAEKPLRERGVIILFTEAGLGLFDRILPIGRYSLMRDPCWARWIRKSMATPRPAVAALQNRR